MLDTYAVSLCRQGKYDEAQKYFDRAIRIPEYDDAFVSMVNAGVCMKQKPDMALAEQYMRDALDRRPNYGEALLQLSVLKYQSDNAMGARAFLERYLASNEPTPAVLFLGIRIEEKAGDDRARDDYIEQLLGEFPDSAEARTILERR